MAITNIKVSNFKSFKDLDLSLRPFNVVVGANASGKSNFTQAFKFLKTLERENLDDTISLHGGSESILNKRLASSEPLRMEITSNRQMTCGGLSYVQIHQTTYGFGLDMQSPRNGAIVTDDHLTQEMRVEAGGEGARLRVDVRMREGTRKVEIGPQDLIDRVNDKRAGLDNAWLSTPYNYIRALADPMETWKANALLLRVDFFGFIGPDSLFETVGVYDIDPRVVKSPHEMAGRASLEEDGGNLALIVKQIRADAEKSRKFHNLLHYMLPFAEKIGTTQYLGTSILLKLREMYYHDALFANLLSDGTLDVVALIVALFFEDKDVVIIEEPERNLHPHLISGLMELMKDASRNKQVIITTHSPEIVKHAGLENLLLVARDEEGFSTISRPGEKEAVKVFLQNELGLDDLFVQDLLAAS